MSTTSTGTVYELAQQLLDLLLSVGPDLPRTLTWAQYGTPIVTCEGTAVGVTGVREIILSENASGSTCIMMQVVDVLAVVARNCAFESGTDGMTDPQLINAVMPLVDGDVTAMLDWEALLDDPPAQAGRIGLGLGVTVTMEGGLAVTSLQASVNATQWPAPG